MAYWRSKEDEAAAKGVLKEKQFVDQTIWLTEDNSVIEKGIAEKQNMVPFLSTGFGYKEGTRTF